MRTSRFKGYLFKSRINLLNKINMKPYFIFMMTMVKVNYIKDAHNNGKNYFDIDIPKKF